MNRLQKFSMLLLSAVLFAGMTTTAFASKYEDPIDGVSIELDYELSTSLTKDDIKVECDNSGIDEVKVTGLTNVTFGKRPQVTIRVKADTSDGYYFDKEDASEIRQEGFWSISGAEAEFKSGKRSSNSTATVTLQLPKIGGDDRSTLSVDTVYFDESGVAYWDAPDDASSYTVRLYKGESRKTAVTTENLWYDFSSLIRQYGVGTYYVSVKGKAGNYSAEDWTDSEEYEVTDENLYLINGSYRPSSGNYSGGNSYNGGASNPTYPSGGSSGGQWINNNGKWWYCKTDRTYPANKWEQIDGYWFLFDAEGYARTGWTQSPSSGLWYYLSPDQMPIGHMMTNTWIGQYYVDGDGVWRQ